MPEKANHLDGKSLDIAKGNLEQLKKIFPEAFTESDGVDFDQLKSTLGEQVDLGERYGLSWKGKSNVFRAIQEPTTKTLKPQREESVDFDATDNIFIEGDNLEALKVLQKAYYGKVKMIYIDPPYNTGNDFVYNDRFAQNRADYEQEAGIRDEDGNITETSGLQKNTRDSGHFHSNWLNMMYPRLYLARNLLRQDGVIFVSIDDNEVYNLRLIMNEIFGEENFVGNFLWKKKSTTSNVEDAQVSSLTDYTLCYKRSDSAKIKQRITLKETRSYPHHDDEGDYRLTVIEKKDSGSYQRDTMKFEILGKKPRAGKRWQIGLETAKALESKNRFVYEDEKIKLKIYDFEDKDTLSAQSNLLFEHGTTESGAKDIELLFGIQELFDNPKPKELVEGITKLVCNNGDTVLDFFAGSGTSAHAIMRLNTSEYSNLRWILIQLDEKTELNSVAYKAGYTTISDIAKERVRLAAKTIGKKFIDKKSDFGFKSLKLDRTNFKIWDSTVKDQSKLEQQMKAMFDTVRDNAKEEDLLIELMLKSGIEPTAVIAKKEDYWLIGKDLVISLAPEVTQETFTKILSEKPQKAILLDRALGANDQLKTNLLLQAEKANVEVLVV